MHITTTIQIGTHLCGVLTVARLEPMGRPNKDLFRYSALFHSPEWNGNQLTDTVIFRHRFSYGVLSLQAAAIQAILKRYPELRSGRPGVPRNRIQCRRCKQILWSRDRHESIRCRCGRVSVDGGYEYRHLGGEEHHMKILHEPWEKISHA